MNMCPVMLMVSVAVAMAGVAEGGDHVDVGGYADVAALMM